MTAQAPAEIMVAQPDLGAEIDVFGDLQKQALEYLEASKSPATTRAYTNDWSQITKWGNQRGLTIEVPLSHEIVAAYLTDNAARLKAGTLARRLAAIKHWHSQAGHLSPTDHPVVRGLLSGIRRVHKTPKKQAKPLYLDDLATALGSLDGSVKDTRDRALLLTGWWSACRRSELIGLDVDDLEDTPEGILVTIRQSKTDQEAQGRQIALHYRNDEGLDPVRAIRRWLDVAGISEGPVFVQVGRWGVPRPGERLSSRMVSLIVKDMARTLGLDSDGYSAHSLRSGFVSECDRRGIPAGAVRTTTGHQSDAMLNSYSRPGQLFRDSAGNFFDI